MEDVEQLTLLNAKCLGIFQDYLLLEKNFAQ
jgi:hypothetical protein